MQYLAPQHSPNGDRDGGLLSSVSLMLSGPAPHHHIAIAQLLGSLFRQSRTTLTAIRDEISQVHWLPSVTCLLQNEMNFLSDGKSSSPSLVSSLADWRAFR